MSAMEYFYDGFHQWVNLQFRESQLSLPTVIAERFERPSEILRNFCVGSSRRVKVSNLKQLFRRHCSLTVRPGLRPRINSCGASRSAPWYDKYFENQITLSVQVHEKMKQASRPKCRNWKVTKQTVLKTVYIQFEQDICGSFVACNVSLKVQMLWSNLSECSTSN